MTASKNQIKNMQNNFFIFLFFLVFKVGLYCKQENSQGWDSVWNAIVLIQTRDTACLSWSIL